jgi:hypothetical protein
MRLRLAALLLGAAIACVPARALTADRKADAAHLNKDVADHRAMAEAHLNAAKCLEAGIAEKECQTQLAKDCKGLGIGKYCGMKHKH